MESWPNHGFPDTAARKSPTLPPLYSNAKPSHVPYKKASHLHRELDKSRINLTNLASTNPREESHKSISPPLPFLPACDVSTSSSPPGPTFVRWLEERSGQRGGKTRLSRFCRCAPSWSAPNLTCLVPPLRAHSPPPSGASIRSQPHGEEGEGVRGEPALTIALTDQRCNLTLWVAGGEI